MALTQFNAAGGLGVGSTPVSLFDSAGKVLVSTSSSAYKNMLINGDFLVDQRNGAANSRTSTGVTSATNSYPADKWRFNGTSAAVITATRSYGDGPTPQHSYLRCAVTTASATYTALAMINRLEGFTTTRLLYGTANAKTSSVSLWARSSLTGKFSFAIMNSATNRSYVSSFTIAAANTWQKFTFRIPGDTTGTWLHDSNIGATFCINLQNAVGGNTTAVNAWAAGNFTKEADTIQFGGTLSSTLDFTAVQWEVGEVATDFEHRTFYEELDLCRRYCFVHDASNTAATAYSGITGFYTTATGGGLFLDFFNELRTAPTLTTPDGLTRMRVRSWGPSAATSQPSVFTLSTTGTTGRYALITFTAGTGRTLGSAAYLETGTTNNNFKLVFSADL